MEATAINEEILQLQGKTVRITQGAYKGEMGIIADILQEEGSIFFVVILESGKERYFTKDFIEVIEEGEGMEEAPSQEQEEIEFPDSLDGYKLQKNDKDNYAFYKEENSYGFPHGIEIIKLKSKYNNAIVYEVRHLAGNEWKETTWVIVSKEYYKSIKDIIEGKPLTEKQLIKHLGIPKDTKEG